mmetsp:Transcript_25865/g.29837  ORF Transcript_25865/g.29837 Transcript_25865/m.29837 type:complete len:215 (-) Transcript_25865:124-768(-)
MQKEFVLAFVAHLLALLVRVVALVEQLRVVVPAVAVEHQLGPRDVAHEPHVCDAVGVVHLRHEVKVHHALAVLELDELGHRVELVRAAHAEPLPQPRIHARAESRVHVRAHAAHAAEQAVACVLAKRFDDPEVAAVGGLVFAVELGVLLVLSLVVARVLRPVQTELAALPEALRAAVDAAHEGQRLCVDELVLLQVVREREPLVTVLALELISS